MSAPPEPNPQRRRDRRQQRVIAALFCALPMASVGGGRATGAGMLVAPWPALTVSLQVWLGTGFVGAMLAAGAVALVGLAAAS